MALWSHRLSSHRPVPQRADTSQLVSLTPRRSPTAQRWAESADPLVVPDPDDAHRDDQVVDDIDGESLAGAQQA